MKKLVRRMGSSIISLMLVFSLCSTVRAETNDEIVTDTSVIIDFIDYDMDKNEPYMTFILSENESVETVNLPKTLQVKVEGREETETISVTWYNEGDVDNTENERYIFLPKWDETVYQLSSELQLDQLPYIEVKKENVGIDHDEFKEALADTSETVKIIGTDGDYQSFFNLFNDSSVDGDVIVKLNDDITETISDNNFFIIPERFTSLTIESNSKGETRTLKITGDYKLPLDLFVNGSKLIVGEDIIIDADAIYGGNFREEVNQSPYIEINGKCNCKVFGGGKQANVDGDTTIIINGNVSDNVTGGGNATPADGYNGNIEANVTGSVTIELNSGGYADKINGGGFAKQDHRYGKADEEYTADVYGNVNLYINGTVNLNSEISVIGGGITTTDFTINNVFNVNVKGDVSIIFGADAKGNNDCIGVYGSGYATDGASGSNRNDTNIVMNAKVGGDVSITAIEDSKASTEQSTERQFQNIYGGGFANGRGADVTVEGDVTITTARKTWDCIYGGGYAEYGGTADILGKANITIQSISGQSNGYANAKDIYGGGKVYGTYDNANDGMSDVKISQANVGGVSINIEPGAVVSGNIHGGGYARGLGYKQITNESFNKCPSSAKVQGNIEINIADNITINGSLYNGGYTYINGDSSVTGSIRLNTGEKLNITSNYYGGGLIYGETSNFVSNAISNIEGNVTADFGKSLTIGGNFYGGGFNTNPNSTYITSINIGGKISTEFKGGATIAKTFSAAGYVNGVNMNAANADVSGGLSYTFNGNFSCNKYYGTGYAYKSIGTMNFGTEDTIGKDIIKMVFKGSNNTLNSEGLIYNGGFVNNSKMNIYGNSSFTFDGVSPNKAFYGTGYAIGVNGNININGSVNYLFKDITLNNAVYNGGYVKNNASVIVSEDAIIEFENVFINNSIYNGGYIDDQGKMDINGNAKLIFTQTKLPSSKNGNIYGGGWGQRNAQTEIKGISIIEFRNGNTIYQPICNSGYFQSKIGKSEIYVIGKQDGYFMNGKTSYKGNEIVNGTSLIIGDGSTETLINTPYLLYIDDVTILDNASLELSDKVFDGSNNMYSLLNSVKNLTINYGGVINLVNKNGQNKEEIISGNYTGGGKIIIEAGKKLEIGGTASGTTAIEIIGNPSIGDEYISVAAGGDEQFNYQEAGLLLVNNITGSQHHWILEAETVTPPNNELTGIINNAEYTVGELIHFTAVGEGMDNLTPQNNDVRWVPINWLVTEEVNFDSDAYSGLIDTMKLSAGNYNLTVKFKMQKYVNSSWTDTDHEDVKKVTFTIKAKSSSGSNYRPSGKTNGFVTEKNKTYYYDKGKPVESGFIFLDSNEKLLAAVPADQFSGNVHNAKAIYYVKKDKTIAKHEWIILNEKGEFISTMPLDKFQNIYGEEYKIYAARNDGSLVQSWLEVNGTWYYFKEDYTARYQYWQAHWNDWYMFENYTYVCNRWIPTSEGRWYYVDAEGKMVSNQWIDGCWINEEGIYWSPYYQ